MCGVIVNIFGYVHATEPLLNPAVKAANNINRMMCTRLIYAVSCLEQVGEEEG